MLCQAKAFLPVSTNQEGTAWLAFIASPKAAKSRSSSQPSRTWLASPNVDLCFTLTKADEGARPAQPVQAAGPLRADAPDRDAELLVDFRVGMRRIAEEHRQQLLAARRQLGEGRAQGRVPLSHEDLLIDHRVVHEQHRVVPPRTQPLGFIRRRHDTQAFACGG